MKCIHCGWKNVVGMSKVVRDEPEGIPLCSNIPVGVFIMPGHIMKEGYLGACPRCGNVQVIFKEPEEETKSEVANDKMPVGRAAEYNSDTGKSSMADQGFPDNFQPDPEADVFRETFSNRRTE